MNIERRISANQTVKLPDKAKSILAKELLFEIFVLLSTQDGKSFPELYYIDLRNLLLKECGGVTVYHRCPATCVSDGNNNREEQDMFIVFEVMTISAKKTFWNTLKQKLEMQLQEKEEKTGPNPDSKGKIGFKIASDVFTHYIRFMKTPISPIITAIAI